MVHLLMMIKLSRSSNKEARALLEMNAPPFSVARIEGSHRVHELFKACRLILFH